ncbi:MAG: alpha/beta hydrolase, partial [Bacteroidales bacterium]|nr:alpha/beta hydrolase [Bacteroidales bacterium]
FKEASPLSAVAKCTKPMLFIHGDADDFVPFYMLQPLYEAKPEPKDLYVAAGSEHAKSYKDHPDEYTTKVVNFVSKYIE